VSLEPDPVIEYYKQFIDRSLLRENLKLTPTERVRKFLPSTTYECHHDPPRDPQNPNEGLTPCKDGCVVTYFGRLLHCPGYLDGTIQECDVGFDPDRQRSAWAYQELRRFIGCRADREHWQEFLRINVGCGSCAQGRVMWRCVIPTALPKFVNAQDSNPPSPRPSPPLTRGERAGSGGILHAQEFVNSGSAIGIIDDRDNQDRCKRGLRIRREYRRPGFKCCSEGGVSPTIGPEYSIPANTL
jgi:hypothetical protein